VVLCYGNRIKATFGSATTVYVGNYFEWTGSTSTMKKYYYAGGQRVAMRQGSTLNWLLGDHLGSTAITVDDDGTAEVGELRYYAYGATRYSSGSTPTSYRFTGQREDATIGLYFYNARYYDAALGRFVQADTIVPEPGNPQSLNRYSYVVGNPLRYIDPTGHWYGPDEYDPAGIESVEEREEYAEMTGDESVLRWYPREHHVRNPPELAGIRFLDFTAGGGVSIDINVEGILERGNGGAWLLTVGPELSPGGGVQASAGVVIGQGHLPHRTGEIETTHAVGGNITPIAGVESDAAITSGGSYLLYTGASVGAHIEPGFVNPASLTICLYRFGQRHNEGHEQTHEHQEHEEYFEYEEAPEILP
jgi:RHS repeat-associated protein